jgi:hypothetical protein
MGDVGLDLWSGAAVLVLKTRLGRATKEAWSEALKECVDASLAAASGAASDQKASVDNDKAEIDRDNNQAELARDDHADPARDDDKTDPIHHTKAKSPEPDVESTEVMEKVTTEDDGPTGDMTVSIADAKPEAADTHAVDPRLENRNLLVQWLFDVAYIRQFLGRQGEEMLSLAQDLRAHVQVDDDGLGRIEKAAQEYYKRTSLLFGLLASHNP